MKACCLPSFPSITLAAQLPTSIPPSGCAKGFSQHFSSPTGPDPNWGKGSSRGERFQQLVAILGRVGSCHLPIKSYPLRPGEAVSIGVTLSPK